MADDANRVTLRVNGRDYIFWTAVDISYGIETAARSFSIEAIRPRAEVTGSPVDFFLGDDFELFIGQNSSRTKVVTGYIDAIAPSGDAGSTSIGVSGRSKTEDIVDSSAVGKRRFNRQRFDAIVLALIEPHGISAIVDGDAGELVKRFSIDVGERVFDVLERLSERFGFLIYDDADGDLVFQRAQIGSFPRSEGDFLKFILDGSEDSTVLSVGANFNASGIYSEYRCRGQDVGTDEGWGEVVTGIEATERSQAIGRRRVLILTGNGESRSRCLARVQIEATTRLARASQATYEVPSWRRADGQIWQPGMLIPVRDQLSRIDGEMLIVNVGLHLSNDRGRVAEISVGPEYGYLPKLPRNAKRTIGAWRSPI